MNATMESRRSPAPPLGFVVGAASTLVVTLGIMYVLLHPPMNEYGPTASFLAITATISVAAGYGAYRLGWVSRAPRISWALLSGYALSSVLTF